MKPGNKETNADCGTFSKTTDQFSVQTDGMNGT